MTRLSKFLIVCAGAMLVLAACGKAERDSAQEDVVVGETATSTSSVQAVSTNSRQAISPNLAQPFSPTAVENAQPTIQPTSTVQPTNSPQPIKASYPNLGSAPEIENQVWLNADQPVTLVSQRGKVVLVEFWTYG